MLAIDDPTLPPCNVLGHVLEAFLAGYIVMALEAASDRAVLRWNEAEHLESRNSYGKHTHMSIQSTISKR
jgi:hypothetical protein